MVAAAPTSGPDATAARQSRTFSAARRFFGHKESRRKTGKIDILVLQKN
jgi:hypothetical protein